ncbi:MAG TPA: hypothetical protein VF278_00715 [Pirellulales bacterium]
MKIDEKWRKPLKIHGLGQKTPLRIGAHRKHAKPAARQNAGSVTTCHSKEKTMDDFMEDPSPREHEAHLAGWLMVPGGVRSDRPCDQRPHLTRWRWQ